MRDNIVNLTKVIMDSQCVETARDVNNKTPKI